MHADMIYISAHPVDLAISEASPGYPNNNLRGMTAKRRASLFATTLKTRGSRCSQVTSTASFSARAQMNGSNNS